MIELPEPPHLEPPTERVRISYLTGEQADCVHNGADTAWLAGASRDFAAFTAARRGIRERWGVPSTVFWWVSGEHYLGTLVLRHRLTHELAEIGGHIGYHVVLPWRRQGHATRMLAAGLHEAAAIGLDRVLVTCDAANEPSRKVILANGGESAGGIGREDRFWIRTPLPQGE
jgi:predicted acetyltransferase